MRPFFNHRESSCSVWMPKGPSTSQPLLTEGATASAYWICAPARALWRRRVRRGSSSSAWARSQCAPLRPRSCRSPANPFHSCCACWRSGWRTSGSGAGTSWDSNGRRGSALHVVDVSRGGWQRRRCHQAHHLWLCLGVKHHQLEHFLPLLLSLAKEAMTSSKQRRRVFVCSLNQSASAAV
jgi:hypothetical protein